MFVPEYMEHILRLYTGLYSSSVVYITDYSPMYLYYRKYISFVVVLYTFELRLYLYLSREYTKSDSFRPVPEIRTTDEIE